MNSALGDGEEAGGGEDFNGKTFSLHSELDWNKALDYAHDDRLNIWDYNASKRQIWTAKYSTTTQAYQLISKHSGNCLMANSSGELFLTNPTFQFADSFWKLVKDEPYSCYFIENYDYGTVLDVSGSNTTNGQSVTAFAKHGGVNQLWRLFENRLPDFTGHSGVIRIASDTTQCLDKALQDDIGGPPTDNLIVFTYREGDNQHWTFTKTDNGTYVIQSDYIWGNSGVNGIESQFWLESSGSKPTVPNITLSVIEGGKSEWNVYLIADNYDYDGRALFAIESATQPGRFLRYTGTQNGSPVEYASGMPGANDRDKLFSIDFD